jgi:hypothetical protein
MGKEEPAQTPALERNPRADRQVRFSRRLQRFSGAP